MNDMPIFLVCKLCVCFLKLLSQLSGEFSLAWPDPIPRKGVIACSISGAKNLTESASYMVSFLLSSYPAPMHVSLGLVPLKI